MEMRKDQSFGAVFTKRHMPGFAHRKWTTRFPVTTLTRSCPKLSGFHTSTATVPATLFHGVRENMEALASGRLLYRTGVALWEARTCGMMGSL